MITRSLPGSQDVGPYTPKQLSEYWHKIRISAASRNTFQKDSRELIIPSMAKSGHETFTYYAPRTEFCVDGMILPVYFKNQFLETFGSIFYVLNFPARTSPPCFLSNLLLISHYQSSEISNFVTS